MSLAQNNLCLWCYLLHFTLTLPCLQRNLEQCFSLASLSAVQRDFFYLWPLTFLCSGLVAAVIAHLSWHFELSHQHRG